MKLILLFIAFSFCISISGFSQKRKQVEETEVPVEVPTNLYSYYPNAEVISWHLDTYDDGNELYAAKIIHDKKRLTVKFNFYNELSQEIASLKREVPDVVSMDISSQYASYKVVNYDVVKNLNNKQLFYLLTIKTKEDGEKSFLYDEDLTPRSLDLNKSSLASH